MWGWFGMPFPPSATRVDSERSKGEIITDPNDSPPAMLEKFEVVYREDIEAASKEEAVQKAMDHLARAHNNEDVVEFKVKQHFQDPSAPNAKAYLYFIKVGRERENEGSVE
jgi:hypothetical protein